MILQSYKTFIKKHVCIDIDYINFDYITKLYRFLPRVITILTDVPDVEDFYYIKGNDYVSKKKVLCHVINSEKRIFTKLEAYVYISFTEFAGEYLPVHFSKVCFETASFYYSKSL